VLLSRRLRSPTIRQIMGISVHLWVDSTRIHAERWQALYDDVLRVVRAYPDGALAPSKIDVCGVEVFAYTSEVEGVRFGSPCVRVCGDRQSRLTGELFEFPQRLWGADQTVPEHPPSVLSRFSGHWDQWPADIFGSKTVGYPYHALIVAIALLAENRFPGLAAAGGDLTAADADAARALLEDTLGESFAPPIVLDEERLRAHLSQWLDENAISEAVSHLCVEPCHPIVGDIIGMLRRGPLSAIRDDLEYRLRSVRDLHTLAEHTRDLLDQFARRLEPAFDRGELRHGDTPLTWRGHDVLLRFLARREQPIPRLTEAGWAGLRSAPTEHLQLCAAVSLLQSSEWHLSHIVRAVFENDVVRSHVYDEWRRTTDARA
jgi:hypothetical protein